MRYRATRQDIIDGYRWDARRAGLTGERNNPATVSDSAYASFRAPAGNPDGSVSFYLDADADAGAGDTDSVAARALATVAPLNTAGTDGYPFGVDLAVALLSAGYHIDIWATWPTSRYGANHLYAFSSGHICSADDNYSERVAAFLDAIDGCNSLEMLITNTATDSRLSDGADVLSMTAHRYLTETYGDTDGTADYLSHRDFSYARYSTVYLISDGHNVPVSSALADDIVTLFEHGYIDDSDTRHAIEMELIADAWQSWVLPDMWTDLPDYVQEFLSNTDDDNMSVYLHALESLNADTCGMPEFEGSTPIIDTDALAPYVIGRVDALIALATLDPDQLALPLDGNTEN